MRMLLTALLLLVACQSAQAAERANTSQWPSWRGPDENGSAQAGNYPTDLADARHRLWTLELPGRGCSTPAVWNRQIFLTGSLDGKNSLLKVDWDGRIVWKTPLGAERDGKHRNASGSNPSPVTDGQTVFVYFKSGELAAVDFAGKTLWQTNLQERFAKDTLYWDVGTSPVLTSKSVVVAVMHTGESYLAAFDKTTGELQWKFSRNYETPVEGDQSYTTPLVIQEQGREVILVWGAEHLTAHSVDDGHELWTCSGFNPERQGNWVAVASAVVAGDMAIVPWGRGSHLTGVRLGGSGDVSTSRVAWVRDDTGAFVPTPAVDRGKLIVVRDEGEVDCIDPATGKTLFSGRFPKHRMKFYASPLVADGKLYAIREDGAMFAATIDGRFEQLSEIDLGEQIIASPVAVDGRLLVRGESHLFCFGQ